MHISDILHKIDSGDIALPEFQRGYVWTRDQVRGFFQSLYRGYPIGGFLAWSTKAEGVDSRGSGPVKDGTVQLLLDGQQRVTTLYAITRGRPPEFFEGDPTVFTGLHFNLDNETFAFYAPTKMKGNPAWVDVTSLFQRGVGEYLPTVLQISEGDTERQNTYFDRLNRITQIKDRAIHVEEVTGEDKTIDVVVDIFNRVNSGGTKLSKGDLALAAICASWPGARTAMNNALKSWADAGYEFKLDWLLRNINAIITGEAEFSKLTDVDVAVFQDTLPRAIEGVSHLLNSLGGRLGLDHGRVLNGRGAFPVMSRLLDRNGGNFPDAMTRDRLFYWYIHSFLWGRHAGATETTLNQDLQALDEGGVDALISVLGRSRGHLKVRPDDFLASSMGSRFYPLLYLLTRVHGAQDFVSGVPLKDNLLGRLSSLQVHHIFPKVRLYEQGYSRGDINAVANFCFLTQETNLKVGAKSPDEYLGEICKRIPGALESQWIPMDRELWQAENYHEFLSARRVLLADAANDFLGMLHDGPSPVAVSERSAPLVRAAEPSSTETRDEVSGMEDLIAFLQSKGFALPEQEMEVNHPVSGEAIVVATAFWPQGLQEEVGTPVVLVPWLSRDQQATLESCDYRIFHSPESLLQYVEAVLTDHAAV